MNIVYTSLQVPSLYADKVIAEAEIRKQATIYKKESLRPLSEYQRRINETAQDICVKNPTMLRSRKMLLVAAQEEVNKSYKVKKGKAVQSVRQYKVQDPRGRK